MSISSDYKTLNRFSPNATFIIFKRIISSDDTEKDGDPTLLFQWTERRMEGARSKRRHGSNFICPWLCPRRERERAIVRWR